MPTEVDLSPERRDPLDVYRIKWVLGTGVEAFITGRDGGLSVGPYESLNLATHVGDDPALVAQNRELVAQAIGVDVASLVTVTQVHAKRVTTAERATNSTRADAILASSPGLAIAVMAADCLAVLVVDEASPQFAVVHAGWRGLVARVLPATVARFADPRTLRVFIGPSISPDAYQVGPDVAHHFTAVPGALRRDHGDRSRLDLRHVALSQLLDAGILDEHIALSRQMTDGGERFFSDRAQRPCGRFVLVAMRGPVA